MNQTEISSFTKLPFIKDITNQDKFLTSVLANKKVYCGFDPSAPSLHLGNYIQIIMLKRLASLGLKPIVIIGTATGFIGDPSGKKTERVLLNREVVLKNSTFIKKQVIRFFVNNVQILNNYDWLKNFSLLEFLRDFGKFFNISNLVNRDQVAKRLQTGISFTEFSYVLLQAYDFYHLYKNYDCFVQIGGSDQWSNIVFGIDFIRKMTNFTNESNPTCGITFNLLTNKDGTKFGKSHENALFLEPSLTLPYEIYQYLLNVDDNDVSNLFYYLTSLSITEINAILKTNPVHKLSAILAKIVLEEIHGTSVSNDCVLASQLLFSKDLKSISFAQQQVLSKTLPLYQCTGSDLVIDLLVKYQIINSKNEFYRLVKARGIKINQQLVLSNSLFEDFKPLGNDLAYIVQIGKRHRFVLNVKVK